MKILIVSAYYPPHHIGGYELGCRDVVDQLRLRGHDVRVLASTFVFENNTAPEEPNVLRIFQRVSDVPRLGKRQECKKFSKELRDFNPDIVYFWNQSELCLWFPIVARWHGYRIAFFLSDTTFASWRVGAWLAGRAQSGRTGARLMRAILGRTFLVRGWPVIQNQPCHFASEFLRNVAEKNGIRVAPGNSTVAHWGIEPRRFTDALRERWPVRRLLYAGQMLEEKGVHTAIAAFGLLAKEEGFGGVTFTIAGGGMHPDYEKKMRDLPAQLGVGDRVAFPGKLPREKMPRIYAEHDVLIFPSEWEEPFAITPLEAMAAGLAVAGTTTGGSGELFRNRGTAMTFRAGDAEDCARAIRELCASRDLFETIRRNGQREVTSRHTLDAMVNVIEKSLLEIAGWRREQVDGLHHIFNFAAYAADSPFLEGGTGHATRLQRES